MLVFDIETGALPREKIAHLCPGPEDVALGNLVDEKKIRAKIEDAQAKFFERAALDATTGRVLAIGFLMQDEDGKDYVRLADGPLEADMLHEFWKVATAADGPLVGHNITGFDLPFLVRRSWLNDIEVPEWVVHSRYFSPKFIDTMQTWCFGKHGEFIKLDVLAQALGLPGKPEGITGADFQRLFEGTPEQRQQALEYLRNDLQMQFAVAEALQVG